MQLDKVMLAILAISPLLSLCDNADLLGQKTAASVEAKLERQLKVLEGQIDHLDWYFKVGYYNHEDNLMMDDVEEFVSNPINTFTMIKRLTMYWPSVRDHLFNQTLIAEWEDLLKEMETLQSSTIESSVPSSQ